jgi:branched-chain amino acid transport system permease protein
MVHARSGGLNCWLALILRRWQSVSWDRHQRLFLKRLYGLDPLYGLLLTFGLALIFEGLLREQSGDFQILSVPELLPAPPTRLHGLPNYRAWSWWPR